jgi:hypothetical protein
VSAADRPAPDLPPGRFVELEAGGTVLVREVGRRDRPVLVLLHGWTATADLNWFTAFATLSQR